ncbi:MAG: hypothetical protein ABI836_08465 [Gemmatimonadota bacterium]
MTVAVSEAIWGAAPLGDCFARYARSRAAHRQVRVVDESGEDYLFPSACFKPVRLPPELGRLFPRVGRVGQSRTASRRAQG